MTNVLDGLLVVALEQAVAAPYCSSRLADAGARVIKVERAEGDFARDYDHLVQGDSAYFVWLNRGKESICLDIKQSDDLALLRSMIDRADVFIQNLAPGATERAGIGSDALRAANPRLITVDISGYGESGPYREMKAYDLLVQCESGLASITGSPEQPGRVGVSICDIACGMYAHAAILQALLQRERSGCGTGIKVSLFDAIADWMTVPLLHQVYGNKPTPRVGLNHASIAPYGAYALGDGSQIVIAVQNHREWEGLCSEVLGDASLATHPLLASNVERCRHRDTLDAEIAPRLASLSREEAVARLERARVAYGFVNSVADLAQHPQLRRITVAAPGGPVELVAPPAQTTSPPALRAVPALGAHSAALRREFLTSPPELR